MANDDSLVSPGTTQSRRGNKPIPSSLLHYEEVQEKVDHLKQQCDILEVENEYIKKKQLERKNKRIADLKQRNSVLVSVARKLEQKAKDLYIENNKRLTEAVTEGQDLAEQKKEFAILAAEMQSAYDKSISDKDYEISSLNNQVETLKKALQESKAAQVTQSGNYSIAEALKQSQKDSLQLQKLAAAGSKKVAIRSLSMPVTARQKILEESNRNLRRQLAHQESSCSTVCDGLSIDNLRNELEKTKLKCCSLGKKVKESSVKTVNLESQLQVAKVEASDTNIQLNEVKQCLSQLQEEYSTVHQQLSVAIEERDAAILQCKENSAKLNDMQISLRNMECYPGDDGNGAAIRNVALERLQTKVLELEKQCHTQNEANKVLNARLIKMMERSAQNSANLGFIDEQPDTTRLREMDSVRAGDETHCTAQNQPEAVIEKPSAMVTGTKSVVLDSCNKEDPMQKMIDSGVEKVTVHIAKFTYNPFEGPNESPEAELPLVAGDYVYVYGSMDEDGFFEGELVNGRRGLVPSNFVEPVNDETDGLFSSKINKSRCGTSDCETSANENMMAVNNSFGGSQLSNHSDISVSNNAVTIHGVLPYPRKLSVEKKLSHSLVIGWTAPPLGEGECIDEYQVFVNGEFHTAVSGKKEKAVVENIHHEKAYKIAVCAVSQWGMSDVNLCTMSHGQRVNWTPTVIRMENVCMLSARVAWTPASSQLCHIVTVKEEPEPRSLRNSSSVSYTVPPPAYSFTFGNLRPNVQYRVDVRIKGISNETEAYIKFKTPEAGPPDPPLNVLLEQCQNPNYLLITWFPVTLNTLGTSNGVVIKGYSIYVADSKICEVQSPTIDQCTVRTRTVADVFKKQFFKEPGKNFRLLMKHSYSSLNWNKHIPPSLTMKTRAVNGQESDYSEPCIISQDLYSKILKFAQEDSRLDSQQHLHCSAADNDADVSFSSDVSISAFCTPQYASDADKIRGTDSYSSSHQQKTKVFQQTRVVPSIEITQDTSSSEDEGIPNNVSSISLSFQEKRTRSGHSSKKSSNDSSVPVEMRSMLVDEERRSSDSEDIVSVSSSHTSSSNGVDLLKNIQRNSVAKQSPQALRQERNENSEYSNHRDSSLNNSNRKNILLYDADDVQIQNTHCARHKRHLQHNALSKSRETHSAASDDHSQGSCRSQSSSHYSHHRNRRTYKRDAVRQSTVSSHSGSELASEVDSTYPIGVDRSKVSLFVALYAYDPQLMSPNTDTYEEELTFSEGQLIKVYGTKDEDGFYYGETHSGMRGYVPCNMVSQVEVESMQMLHDLHERGHLPSASPDDDEQSSSDVKTKTGAHQGQNDQQAADKSDLKTRFFVALFDYNPRQLSPNIDVDVEISFSCGDVITVYGDMDDDGFYKGELGGKMGLVPSNFIEEIPEPSLHQTTYAAKAASDIAPRPTTKHHQNQNNSGKFGREVGPVSSTHVSEKTVNPHVVDNAKMKKGGFLHKGKKLLRKLGNSQDGKRR